MMSRIAVLLTVLGLTLLTCSTGRAQATGGLPDVKSITFRGATEFVPEQLVRGLQSDAVISSAVKSDMSLDAYVNLLQTRLLEGYLYAGYGQAQVAVSVGDGDKPEICADIDSGPLLSTAGEVRVTGAGEDVADIIRRRLGDGQAAADASSAGQRGVAQPFIHFADLGVAEEPEKSLWCPGKKTGFHTLKLEQIRQRVKAALEDAGYCAARSSTRVEFEAGTAILHVHVEELGAQATVSELVITGNRRNADEAVVKLLDVHIGEPWTAECRRRIMLRIWNSARFIEPRVDTENIDTGVRLLVSVKEYAAAPKLDEDFSREEAACLKLRDWLTRGAGLTKDLVWECRYEKLTCTATVSAQEGVICEFTWGDPAQQQWLPKHIIVVTSTGLRVYEEGLQKKFTCANTHARITPRLDFLVTQNPDPDKTRNIKFYCGAESAPGEPKSGSTTVALSMAPVLFVSTAHDKVLRTEWDGDLLTLWKSDGHIAFNSRTGEFVEGTVKQENQETRWATARYVEQAFQRRLDELEAVSRDWQAYPDPAHLLSSSVEFFCATGLPELLWERSATDKRERAVETIQLAGKLARLGLLHPVEAWWRKNQENKVKKFYVPDEKSEGKGMGASFARGLRESSDDLSPPGAWPALAWGEACSHFGHQDPSTDAAVATFRNNTDMGPLACFVAAWASGKQSPHTQQVAAIGLERLDRERFLQDCAMVLSTDHQLGVIVRDWGRILIELTPRELELIESYVHCPGLLSRTATALRNNAQAEDPVLAAAGEMWDTWLERRLSNGLYVLQGIDPLMSTAFPLPASDQ